MSKLTHFLKGAGGIVGVEIAGVVDNTDPSQIAEIGGVVIQVIIGIVTLWGLLKPKKN